ncbi:hypothetical protein CC2G_004236 [Coprinopsis cinerea AmutBmut pab1-1]|nr:hypothetical protein CC2G_004236 [Coprinopsis cinerea AmutBmut pab1-1]
MPSSNSQVQNTLVQTECSISSNNGQPDAFDARHAIPPASSKWLLLSRGTFAKFLKQCDVALSQQAVGWMSSMASIGMCQRNDIAGPL